MLLSAEQWVSGLKATKEDPARARLSVKILRSDEERYRLCAE
jgi:hypothetical protein